MKYIKLSSVCLIILFVLSIYHTQAYVAGPISKEMRKKFYTGEVRDTLTNKVVYPYQWHIYSQAFKAIQPLIENKKIYAILGERVAYFDDGSINVSTITFYDIFDFIVLSEDKKAWHIFPKDVNTLDEEDIFQGNIEYSVSRLGKIDIDKWLPDNAFRILFSTDVFRKYNLLSDQYLTHDIPTEYADGFCQQFFAVFDKQGQIHGAYLSTFNNRAVPNRGQKWYLGLLLMIARERDKNIPRFIHPQSKPLPPEPYKYSPPEWINKRELDGSSLDFDSISNTLNIFVRTKGVRK